MGGNKKQGFIAATLLIVSGYGPDFNSRTVEARLGGTMVPGGTHTTDRTAKTTYLVLV